MMVLNVISEPLRPSPDSNVVAWIDARAIQTLYLTSVSIGEMLFGVASIRAGKRRDKLGRLIEDQVFPLFEGRVLGYGETAARHYGALMASARAKGKAIGHKDGCIAATASANGMMIATRDTGPFEALGLPVINPWLQTGD